MDEERLAEVVTQAVADCDVIDSRTCSRRPTASCCCGASTALYHYLVSEFFMVAPGEITHKASERSKKEQADLIWEHLFKRRSPISEAQIGVLTTLRALGLQDLAEAGDLHELPVV